MNWDQIQGNWNQFAGEMKVRWGKLTDDDFKVVSGMRDKLAGKLQERYGYDKQRAEQELRDFVDTLDS